MEMDSNMNSIVESLEQTDTNGNEAKLSMIEEATRKSKVNLQNFDVLKVLGKGGK